MGNTLKDNYIEMRQRGGKHTYRLTTDNLDMELTTLCIYESLSVFAIGIGIDSDFNVRELTENEFKHITEDGELIYE